MERELIKEIVKETIAELDRQNRLKETEYQEAAEMIKAFYQGRGNPKVGETIKELSGDAYIKIVPKYYKDGYTIEELSIAYDCEPSTIARNKKRLCMEIYRRVK